MQPLPAAPTGAPMMPYRPNPPMLPLPSEVKAAIGAAVGTFLGAGVGSLVALKGLGAPPMSREVVIPEATASQAQAIYAQQGEQLRDDLRKWNRRAHAIQGAVATFGAALGAYLAAAADQKRMATAGAAIGTGAARTVNVLTNPVCGLPGIVAGAVGAYIGASRAP